MSPGFARLQLKKLATGLDPTRVQTRQQDGKTLSYIEGWFAIAEANRIFGYDGWDREMVHFERAFERKRAEGTDCGYVARVRVRVRATETTIVREGTGFGQASATRAGDAHERAVKAAETDATKRALATFGSRFGLMLYDKEQRPAAATGTLRSQVNGLNQRTGSRDTSSIVEAHKTATVHDSNEAGAAGAGDVRSQSATATTTIALGLGGAAQTSETVASGQSVTGYRLIASDGSAIELRSPEGFCSGLRQLLDAASDLNEVLCLQHYNANTIGALRALSDLTTQRGEHYADILERLITQRRAELAAEFANTHPTRRPKHPQRWIMGRLLTSKPSKEPNCPSRQQTKQRASMGLVPGAGLSTRQPQRTSRARGQAGWSRTACWSGGIPPRLPPGCRRRASPKSEPAPTRRSQITGGFSIDKSALLFPANGACAARRICSLSPASLALVCEALPCHAHHITFAQARGLSQKVSDEFTVPLCAVHHNELHAFGNEASWWRGQGIEPLQRASELWRQTWLSSNAKE